MLDRRKPFNTSVTPQGWFYQQDGRTYTQGGIEVDPETKKPLSLPFEPEDFECPGCHKVFDKEHSFRAHKINCKALKALKEAKGV